jgi:chemotaxis protein CheY-P-specific phosphatase CheC
MSQKKTASSVLFGLGIISLLTIAAVLISGIIKNRTNNQNQAKKDSASSVLGEIIEQQISAAPTKIGQFLQEPLEQTKEVVSQKITEVEKEIVTNIQKEMTSLTASQIETVKLQICRDLGVITPAPLQ